MLEKTNKTMQKIVVGKTKTAPKTSKKKIIKTDVKFKSDELLAFVLKTLDDGKAVEMTSIPLMGKTSLADFLVIASGTSTRHVMALASTLADKLKDRGMRVKLEGKQGSGEWLILDLGDIIVHVFHPQARTFYALDELWTKTPKE